MRTLSPRAALPLLTVWFLACQASSASNPVLDALARRPGSPAPPASVAFRFPAGRGGAVRFYRLPRLTEVAWRMEAGGLAAQRVVGFASDADQLYVVTPRGDLAALDLATGRTAVIDSNVALATLGPTGTPFVAHRDGGVTTLANRTATTWARRLPAVPDEIWAGVGGRLVAVVGGPTGRTLIAGSSSAPPVEQPLPSGQVAATRAADLVAVAVDSGLILLAPERPAAVFVAFRTSAQAVALSPSGHRAYAVARGGDLLIVDRYQARLLQRLRLPAEAGALRADALGRLLLVRPAAADSVWIVDLARAELIASVPGAWGEDLPTVAPDGTVLLRQGADVVALAPTSLEVLGRAAGAARDLWLVAAWDPRRPALQAAQATEAPGPVGSPQEFYVQVSSTSNAAWAEDLASNLQSAGLKASVLAPRASESEFRVVIGPYPSHEAATTTGRKLGRSYWIYARDTTTRTP